MFKNYKGQRIYPRHIHAVRNWYTSLSLLTGLAVVLVSVGLSYRKVSFVNWNDAALYCSIIFAISVVISVVVAAVGHRVFSNHIKTLKHKQLLAEMVLSHGWCEKKRADTSFFKDIKSDKEVYVNFPKIYYRRKEENISIWIKITMSKYQKQLQSLEEKLEVGLFAEMEDKELHEGFIEYRMIYNMIGNRIFIKDVVAKKGRLRLMKHLWWKYDDMPHMLVSGGTGGGKTYFILSIIETLLKTNACLYILDPKNSNLADLQTVMPNVYYKKEEIVSCVQAFYARMMERNETMKKIPKYKTGKNYAYCGLEPHFLIFDEYVAFMEMLSMKEREEVLSQLKKVVMLGRQSGFFIILACQRPDAKYLGDGIRDQFNFRVALGKNSALGYGMMFGETDKQFFFKNIKGRGYVDSGRSVIGEIYTPLVPADHDFLEEIGHLAMARGLYPVSDNDADTENVENESNRSI